MVQRYAMHLKSHQKTVSVVRQGFSALFLVFLGLEKTQMSLQNELGDGFERDALAQVVDRAHAVSEVAERVIHGYLIPFPATQYQLEWGYRGRTMPALRGQFQRITPLRSAMSPRGPLR